MPKTAPKRNSSVRKKTKNTRKQSLTLIEGETALDPKNANVVQQAEDTDPPFSAHSICIPDSEQEQIPDPTNPQGVQGGRGPLAQEGEGNRQNDEMDELQQDAGDPLNKRGGALSS